RRCGHGSRRGRTAALRPPTFLRYSRAFMPGLTERQAGVGSVGEALEALLRWVRPTFGYAAGARPALEIGYFANVVPVAPNLGIAISTDGVGTKLLVAQAVGRFDAIGTVALDQVIAGKDVAEGDVLLGLESAGLHSNGFTLARRAIERAGLALDAHVPELGGALADELLRPTRIYVRPVLDVLEAGLPVRALAHVTGDGLFNLVRTVRPVGFDIERWPAPPPIFGLVQRLGQIADEEMYRTFNMGIGFALVVAPAGADEARARLARTGERVHVLGHAT